MLKELNGEREEITLSRRLSWIVTLRTDEATIII